MDDRTYTAAQVRAWLERQAEGYEVSARRETDWDVALDLVGSADAIRLLADRAPASLAACKVTGHI